MENAYYDQIKAYVDDTLTPEQRAAFEAEMARDPDLRLAVEEMPAVMEALDAATEDDARKLVEKTRAAISVKDASAHQATMRRPWLIAASILVLGIAAVITFVNVNYSTAALISAAYQPPSDLGTFQSEGQTNTEWQALMQSWRDGDHDLALARADAFLAERPADPDAIRRVAYLHFRTGNYERALTLYERIREDQQYGDYADFHYALTLMQLGRENEAQEVFDEIIADEYHRFGDEALRMRSRLGSIWHRLAFD